MRIDLLHVHGGRDVFVKGQGSVCSLVGVQAWQGIKAHCGGMHANIGHLPDQSSTSGKQMQGRLLVQRLSSSTSGAGCIFHST